MAQLPRKAHTSTKLLAIVLPLCIIAVTASALIRNIKASPVQATFDDILDIDLLPTIPAIPTVPAMPTLPIEIEPCGCDCDQCPTKTPTPTEVTPTQEVTPTERPTPTLTLTPTPTPPASGPPTGGGGGGNGGGGNGGGGGNASSGGGEVLGAAALAPTGTFSQTLMQGILIAGLGMISLSFFSYLKQLRII